MSPAASARAAACRTAWRGRRSRRGRPRRRREARFFATRPPSVRCAAMKAIRIEKTGGAEVLTLADVPAPEPKPNEAVVKIAASGVNFIDVYFREGRYPVQLPITLGQEAAGT